MKVLFVIGATSRIRNFDHVIEALAARGHTLQLTGRPRKGRFALPKTFKVAGVTGRENPTQRIDAWRDLVDTIRGARDYVRYLAPEYAAATRLVRRAYEISPTGFVLFCERHEWIKRRWRMAAAALSLCERIIPSDPGIEQFVRDEAPDLMLVTPLVTFESYQTDYVKAAHRLGIPIAFLPFSWDNLTNKGLMRVEPDRILVWNEIQKQEAVALHGASPDRIVLIGAARFDDFFAREPATTRAEFCSRYGLDPERPLLLFLGSSQLTGPNEMELVRRWAESIRQAENPALRQAGILIRPHPALRASWTTVDLSDLGHVAISLDASRGADQELYDSLHHAHAAIGLNTSAMLEAAIVGRPVFTLLIPNFDEGQVGTIHFRYLVDAFGGLVTVARTFAEHHAQLRDVLEQPPVVSPRSREFARHFLRPHGLDRPVSPALADEIERLSTLAKRPRRWTPIWHYPLRWAVQRWLRRPPAASARPIEDTGPVATSMSLRPVRTALEELSQENGTIFVGPWLDSIGRELVYWIPFVRWAAQTYGLSPERLIVISRAGARPWYGTLADRYLDARELFRGAEFDDWQRRTIPQSQQNPKQSVMFPFDQEILQRAASVMDLSDYQTLHPMMFFRILQRLDSDREDRRLREVVRHERFSWPSVSELADLVSGEYVALSLAFTDALPGTARNREWLQGLVARLSKASPIVVVDATPDASLMVTASPSRIRLLADMADGLSRPFTELQTQVLAGAAAFYGALGELPLLAAFCGTQSVAIRSEPAGADLLAAIQHGGAEVTWGALTLESVDPPHDHDSHPLASAVM
jgi:hypothetical protein